VISRFKFARPACLSSLTPSDLCEELPSPPLGPLTSRCCPVVLPRKTLSISFLFRPLPDFFLHSEGCTPTPFVQSGPWIRKSCLFSLNPLFATHPRNALVTSLLATLPKTQVLKVLCLPHIQKMTGVGGLDMRRSMSIPFTLLAQSDACEGSLEGSDHRESRDLTTAGARFPRSVSHSLLLGGRLIE
jgi:hypothetical protein